MVFKSPTRPFCRMCGKPIAKRTAAVYVRDADPASYSGYREVSGELHTKADCQAKVNEQVVAIRRRDYGPKAGLVHAFYTWDGESYDDEFFCSGQCAKDMGREAARKGWGTFTWEQAAKKSERR